MNRELVFVHGRAQEHKDSVALKREWVDALADGLRHNGLQLPIAEQAVRFPYYGQALFDLISDVPAEEVAQVIVRGSSASGPNPEVTAVLEEIAAANGITDADILAAAGTESGAQVVERGPLNWPWVLALIKALDQHIPGASGASIALATYDVFQYLTMPGLRDLIEEGVRKAITPGVETVIVAHSLGTVVAYNLLRREGRTLGWKVPMFVTVGSPLAVTRIRSALAPISYPSCVGAWYNARDPHDVVALYPLDAGHFPITPAVENSSHVMNGTPNRHGISGYLADAQVAKRVYDALTR
jgi:hypothetical protein